MKTKIILLKILFFSLFAQAQSLEIILSLDKVEYLECEPIYIIAEVKNNGNEKIDIFPVSISNAESGLDLILKDNDGKVIEPLNDYHWLNHNSMKLITLHPLESAITLTDINDIYANNNYADKSSIAIWNMFLASGNYSLQLKYNFKKLGNENKEFSTEYYSNIVNFKIIKPFREEDLTVYKELLKAKELHNKKEYANYSEKLIYIIENFPKTDYTLLAYKNLFPLINIIKNIDYNKYRNKIIVDFPNSTIIISSIHELIKKDPTGLGRCGFIIKLGSKNKCKN